MFLSAEKIKEAVAAGDLLISPFLENNLKPASYTFTLHHILKDVVTGSDIFMAAEGYVLEPGAFLLGKTAETIDLKNSYLCLLGTRSSIAQQGIDVLQDSTIAEPDTNGQFTLEIRNNGSKSVRLVPGMAIVKGIFSKIIE
jgi:dCTP deaminase